MKKSLVTWGLLLVALYEISKRRQACACGDESFVGGLFSLPAGGGSSNQDTGFNYNFPNAVSNAGAGGCQCGGVCGTGLTAQSQHGTVTVQQTQNTVLPSGGPSNMTIGFISASSGILARDPYTGALYTVYSQPNVMQSILGGADIVRPDGSNYVISNSGGVWYLDGKAIV